MNPKPEPILKEVHAAKGARRPRRILCPRAIMVAALMAHLALALLFWAVSLGFVLAVARLHPVVGILCVLLFITLAAVLTRIAWRRNTWFAALLYLMGCILTLPWTVLSILHWFNPN